MNIMSTFGSSAADGGPETAAKITSSVDEDTIDAALAHNPMLAAIRGTPDHFALGWDAAAYVDVDLTVRFGVRFWITDWFSIALEAGFDVRLTEPRGPWMREPGDVTPYVGLSLGFHF